MLRPKAAAIPGDSASGKNPGFLQAITGEAKLGFSVNNVLD
jgi:hypothetical protein